MTDAPTPAEGSAQAEAVQAVVDRVSSWQQGATDGTVHEELRKGLAEAGVDLDDASVDSLASAIEDARGPVDAAQLLS